MYNCRYIENLGKKYRNTSRSNISSSAFQSGQMSGNDKLSCRDENCENLYKKAKEICKPKEISSSISYYFKFHCVLVQKEKKNQKQE